MTPHIRAGRTATDVDRNVTYPETVTPWGDVLQADPHDIRTGEPDFLQCGGGWQPELDALRSAVPPGGVVIDVGAQYGYLTSYFCHLVTDAGRVYAIEANPRAYLFLRENASRCHWAQATLDHQALGKHSGSTTFWTSENRPGRSSLYIQNVPDPHARSQACAISRLDDYWRSTTSAADIDLLKLDVEGAELDVLLGGTDCLERTSNVWLEFWPDGITQAGHSPFSIVDRLQGAGFRLTCVDIVSGSSLHIPDADWLHEYFEQHVRPSSGGLGPLFEPLVYLMARR